MSTAMQLFTAVSELPCSNAGTRWQGTNNYARFFKVAKQAPFLQVCAVSHMFDKVPLLVVLCMSVALLLCLDPL